MRGRCGWLGKAIMIVKFLLLCVSIGRVELVTHSRNHGYEDGSFHNSKTSIYGTSTYPQLFPMSQEDWEMEKLKEETPDHLSSTITSHQGEREDSDAGTPQSRNGNWCSFVKSQLVTYTAACKKEKYVIKSQQPCSNGAPDCQKIMYRATLKPVYRVRQKVLNSLHWKCCPGYIGKNCEQRDPNFVPVPANHTEGLEDGEEFSSKMSTSLQAEEIMKTIQNHKTLLEDLQNDVHQSAGDLQKLLENNITTMTSKLNQSKSELPERLLQQMLFPHVESFLKEHFNPMWANFNKSLQSLSSMVRNLSKDVEANKKNIEKFQESTVPKKEFQELGTKFESKVQENAVRVEQLKREMDNHLHMQQTTIHYNLTMIKADTDMKLKKYHKIQQSHLLALNSSMTDIKQEQENLEDGLETLNRNLTELSLYCGNKDEATWLSIRQLNETMIGHAKQLKKLYMESDATFEDITVLDKWVKDLKAKSKHESEEFRVALMEKSLIIEENNEALERQILELNYTLSNLQESHWDLLKYMRECNCEKISSDIDILEDHQKNITRSLENTQLNLKEVQHLETSSKDLWRSEIEELSTAFNSIHQSLGYQQEQSRQLMDSMSHLKSQIKILSEDIGFLKKKEEEIHGHIKYLNSSFNSLLEDAMRHETALEALLGAEIMEVLSEENPNALISSVAQVQEALRHTSDKLKEQNVTLESLTKRFNFLEMGRESNHDAQNIPKHPEHKKQTKNTQEEVRSPHSNVEHMEPNHEASRDDIVDNPAYNDIMTLKKEIKHLSMDIKRHQSWRDDNNNCCNHTVINLVEPLSISVEILRTDLVTIKQSFEDHLQIFQKLFGSSEELVASNISLDITKIQSMMTKKMRRQQKGHEKQKRRDKKQTDENREHMQTINGRNKIEAELLEKDSSVAFYVGFCEEWDEVKALKFNETYLNHGNSYFPEQGYFKAPQNGVYMFVINVKFSAGPALGQLVIGRGHRMTLSSSQKETIGSSETTFAMAELKKGERVWFELLQGSIVKRSPPGTTMGGFLIFKT
ncbi:multimerin-2 [Chelonoidis abingdonii]|uniref:multimerin-2 n=1 Tax=Chelonoidis abingdonii TaxID=106734 RepID=UPI0013F29215|nr:multimerin-2 [Chelonoidis abingdonii]